MHRSFYGIALILLLLVGCAPAPKPSATPSNPTAPAAGLEPAPKDTLQVVFLDVGQGDSALVIFPNGKTMLIDGGETDQGRRLVQKLQQIGVKQIDWLVASHPHSDHIGGLIQVLKTLPVGEIWDIAMPFESPVYRDFLAAARGAKTPDDKRPLFRKVRAGLSLEPAPNVRLSVLAPRDPLLTGTRSDPNNNSIVLRIDAPGGSFLFTGDIEREGRRRLAGANLRADVLKVSHHGAANGTDRAFLERVKPRVAVISVGANNRYGHPHRETLALLQGKRVYRTDWHGDIIMRLGADKKLQIASTRRVPDQTSATEKPTKPLITGAVIGNKNSKVYHTPDCPRLPKPENQARFRSVQEAQKAGYRPHACVEGE